mgnify:FL=1|tara:strand:+ start:191 stop:490 length:300 start_codon:yes stop_codon:yes gene_type:complete
MSIVFKPKIPASFKTSESIKAARVVRKVEEGRVIRPLKYWSNKELQKVVDLRALGISLLETSKILKRGPATISAVIVHHSLYQRIATKKAMHIAEVMDA